MWMIHEWAQEETGENNNKGVIHQCSNSFQCGVEKARKSQVSTTKLN